MAVIKLDWGLGMAMLHAIISLLVIVLGSNTRNDEVQPNAGELPVTAGNR
jgi:hypothetical protein